MDGWRRFGDFTLNIFSSAGTVIRTFQGLSAFSSSVSFWIVWLIGVLFIGKLIKI
jgi:hypothetical protein